LRTLLDPYAASSTRKPYQVLHCEHLSFEALRLAMKSEKKLKRGDKAGLES
jgi:hypothetical protein